LGGNHEYIYQYYLCIPLLFFDPFFQEDGQAQYTASDFKKLHIHYHSEYEDDVSGQRKGAA
jgi:hypothetical protein